MSVKDKLQIILITYNRSAHLQETLSAILADDSPIRDFDITVQDNRSTDGTADVVRAFQGLHPNLKHLVNRHNVGGDGNIAKAIERADKEYLWILCDDDKYDWAGWHGIEDAIRRGEPLICAATFNLGKDHRDDVVYQIHQMTFVPSIIYKTALFDDTTLANVFNNIFTHFCQLVPVITHVNHGGMVHVVEHGVVESGRDTSTDILTRGAIRDEVFVRSRTITAPVGFANMAVNLKDRRLALRCLPVLINGEHHERVGYFRFFVSVFEYLHGNLARTHVLDLCLASPLWMRIVLRLVNFAQNTFLYDLLKGSWLARLVR